MPAEGERQGSAFDSMAQCLRSLTRGAHEFHRPAKQAHYRAAREAACDAVTALLVDGQPRAVTLATKIEDDVLRAIAGLLQRSERR